MAELTRNSFLRQTLVLIPVIVNTVLLGCTFGWTPNALYLLNKPNSEITVTLLDSSWIASSVELARIIIPIPLALMISNLSRNKLFHVVGFLHTVSWMGLAFGRSVAVVIIIRIILGTCVTVLNLITLPVIGEMVSPAFRGAFVSLYTSTTFIGFFYESIISIVFHSYTILAYSTLLLTALYFPSAYWLIETPTYLVNNGRAEEAERNIRWLDPSLDDERVRLQMDELKAESSSGSHDKPSSLFTKSNVRIITKAMLYHMLVQGTGFHPINGYIALMLPKNEYISQELYPLISITLQLIASIVFVYVVHNYPRRFVFMIAAAVTCVIHCTNSLAYYFRDDSLLFNNVFLLGNFAYLIIQVGLIYPMINSVKAELFPSHHKTMGTALCTVVYGISNTILYQVFVYFIERAALHYMYLIFSIDAVLLVLAVYYSLPECSGKTLEEIQREMKTTKTVKP